MSRHVVTFKDEEHVLLIVVAAEEGLTFPEWVKRTVRAAAMAKRKDLAPQLARAMTRAPRAKRGETVDPDSWIVKPPNKVVNEALQHHTVVDEPRVTITRDPEGVAVDAIEEPEPLRESAETEEFPEIKIDDEADSDSDSDSDVDPASEEAVRERLKIQGGGKKKSPF